MKLSINYKLKFLLASFIIVGLAFSYGCSQLNKAVGNLEPSETDQGKIQFGYSNGIKIASKSFSTFATSTVTPSAIIVTIESVTGNIVQNQTRLELIKVNNEYMTSPIALTVGTYQLTQFMVVDKNNNTLYLAPLKESPRATLIDHPLPITITVEKDKTNSVIPDVLPLTPTDNAQAFGYPSFKFNIMDTIQIYIGVQGENNTFVTANLVIKLNGTSTLNTQVLTAEINRIETKKVEIFPTMVGAGYQLTISKPGYTDFQITTTDLSAYTLIPLVCHLTLKSVPNPTVISAISAGDFHSLILKSDGTLWGCGSNSCGQLTDVITKGTYAYVPVQLMDHVISMSAGKRSTFILKSDNTLWACGYNGFGNLGDGTYDTKLTTPLQVMSQVASMVVGEYHSLILKTDGTLWACGLNTYGELGNSTLMTSTIPIQITGNVASMAVGDYHSLILKTDGSLWVCGNNQYGQLGNGTTVESLTPIQIMTDIASIAASNYHSLILKRDGTLWACGHNLFGQLGNGTIIDVLTPVQIMTHVTSMATGRYHSLILKTDGTLWACGDNECGQLGNGTTVGSLTPVQIMTHVATMAAGDYHSFILKTDGTLWACGWNNSGRLGDGTTTTRLAPVQIMK